jgi:ribonuclease HI
MMIGVGVVIRDAASCVVAAKATTVLNIVEPTTTETMAAWCTLEFGRARGVGQVILEGDSMVVVDALRATSSCDRDYGQLIDDIK